MLASKSFFKYASALSLSIFWFSCSLDHGADSEEILTSSQESSSSFELLSSSSNSTFSSISSSSSFLLSSSSSSLLPLLSSNSSSSNFSSNSSFSSYSSSSVLPMSSSSMIAFGTHEGRMVYTPIGLWVDTTEVTQADYSLVTGLSPSYFSYYDHAACPRCPVENITAAEAMLYANALTKLEGSPADTVYSYSSMTWTYPTSGPKSSEVEELIQLNIRTDAKGYRLPTEEEWKLLAAGGQADHLVYWTSLYPAGGEASANAGLYAWFSKNAAGIPQIVAQKIPNQFGLYDVMGNVEEYTSTPYEDGHGYISKGRAADATLGALMMMMGPQTQRLTGMRLVLDP